MGTELLVKQRENFSTSFDENKLQLSKSAVIGSKRVRNRVAGYITRKINTKRRS
jgi:small subunit ribosomal protein S17e